MDICDIRIDNISPAIIERGRAFLDRYLHSRSELIHHGIEGQRKGVRNGPPYPLNREQKSAKELAAETKKGIVKYPESAKIIERYIQDGRVKTKVNRECENRHTNTGHAPGRSYINGGLVYAQELVDKYGGTGEIFLDENGEWNRKERIVATEDIGYHVNQRTGVETKTNKGMIIYSKTGTHVYPRI